MFCGQCGKRVLETMLFCPFCGSPIVIPDQDGDAPVPVEPEERQTAEVPEPETPAEAEETAEPEEVFEPLRFDDAPEMSEEIEPEPDADHLASLFDDVPEQDDFEPLAFDMPEVSERIPPADEPEDIASPEPPRPQSPARKRPEGASIRSNQTYIPVRNVSLDDMFMDSSHPEPEEEYDPYDDDGSDEFTEGFSFEEPERGGFLQRHIRGLVGLILLVMLIVIFLVWAITPKGQKLLATANLATSAEAYNDLGYEAYEAGQFRQAAAYFERALSRDDKNYEYAHSAMVAYYEAEEVNSALAMLKKCIEMNPDSAEPYHELLILYPNADDRPWEAQELLRLGYERTGDESLNTAGE